MVLGIVWIVWNDNMDCLGHNNLNNLLINRLKTVFGFLSSILPETNKITVPVNPTSLNFEMNTGSGTQGFCFSLTWFCCVVSQDPPFVRMCIFRVYKSCYASTKSREPF